MPTPNFYVGDYVFFQTPGSPVKGYGRIRRIEEEYLFVDTTKDTLMVRIKNCLPAPHPNSPSITPRNAPKLVIGLQHANH